MNDQSKTKQELIQELVVLRQRIQELEHSESERMQMEDILRKKQSESNLDSLLFPERDITKDEVRQIIDLEAIQELMNCFYRLTGIANALLDLKGNILVAIGWQDICAKFHRIHPQTLENCMKSDVFLSANAKEGKYTIYKCKNNMWDMATPIIVGGRHIANLFLGQFFFEDETPEYGVFVKQAEKYGFNKDEYLAALELVPKWSRETITSVMEFCTKLASMISRLSHRNIQSAKLLLEQKRTAESLRKSEDKSARIFHFSPDAILLMHAGDNIVLDINKACEKLTGYTREEIVGQTSLQLVFFLDPDLWTQVFRTLEAEDEVHDLETRLLRKDRTLAYILISLSRVEIDGEPCYLTIIRDISELKLAEKAAMEREEQLKAKLDTLLSPENNVSIEEVGHIIDFQAIQEIMNSFYKFTGFAMTITDLNGKIHVATGWQDICTKFHRIHHQTLECCKESDVYLTANVEEGKYVTYKCKNNMWDMATPIIVGGRHIANLFFGQFFFKDETPDHELFRKQAEKYGFDVEEYLAALDRVPRWSRETVEIVMKFYAKLAVMISRLSLGNIQLAKALAEQKRGEDMLRRSEANYRSVIENIQDVFYRTAPQGNLIMVSPSFLTLLGYESLADCLGKPIASFYYDPENRAEFLRQLQGKGSVTNYEAVLKSRDGTPVIVETNSHFYFDGAGNIVGVEGIFRDITERKQAEEDRTKLESRLIQAQKMEAIGKLAGGIAHDFNNILSAIMGYTELYWETVRDRPEVYQSMGQVLKAADRAKDLVRQILAFSRKTEYEKKPIILSPIVKEVVKFMRASLPTTIEIKQTINETSGAIMADPSQMHQVLMNLGTNAGQAMKDTGGVLEIGLKEIVMDNLLRHPALNSGRYLELFVRDTGYGISQDNLEKIFEPYFTTKEKGEGTGLGLAVVHGIVKDHDGDISVYSEVGKGAIFKVYLPLIEKKAEDRKVMEENFPLGKGETILFVDDEQMIVDAGRQVMEQLGYRVVTETDPVKAIEVFKENRDDFDLVITDKTMPHMTGFDVAREIKSIRADILLLICSGFQEKEDLKKLKTFGISQLITKPIRKFTLAKAIRDVLDKEQIWDTLS
ncbi:MAG: PocR ligand-binding domain-containing protein [Smithella sp.]